MLSKVALKFKRFPLFMMHTLFISCKWYILQARKCIFPNFRTIHNTCNCSEYCGQDRLLNTFANNHNRPCTPAFTVVID